MPIVFGLLYAVGLGLSFLAFILLAGKETKPRMAIALVAMPFLCAIGYAIFFAVLPYAAWTIGWLKDREVVSATNGPATFFYRFVVRPDIPRIGPQLSDATGDDVREELRNHVLRVYVSPYKQACRHMFNSRASLEYAHSLMNQGDGLFTEIPANNVAKALAAYKESLQEARVADLAQLNNRYSGLGDAWRDKFIPSLENTIKGIEGPSILASMRGNNLYREWAKWYNSNIASE